MQRLAFLFSSLRWLRRLPLRRLWHLPLRPLALLGSLLVCACAPGGASPAGEASSSPVLRHFPGQAAAVLDSGAGFTRSEQGFSARPAARGGFRPAGGSLDVALPARGEDAVVLRGSRGFELRVRERGAAGEGAIEGRAVAYARGGGRSYWSARDSGAEEWLFVPAGEVASDRPVASWDVEGGALRQAGEAVEISDAAGAARVRVTAPRAFAEGGRAVRASLAARGARIELSVAADFESVLIDPEWGPAAAMKQARSAHTATLLPDGRVLACGGGDAQDKPLASAELYDPATDVWTATGSLKEARTDHTAILLPNGKVLVAGGAGAQDQALASAELYDPASGKWTAAPSMTAARRKHTALLLSSGKVLVLGGSATPSAEIYDPASGALGDWLPTKKAPLESRASAGAVLLPDGKVLVAGGLTADLLSALASAEIYDPLLDEWKETAAPMSAPRGAPLLALLPGGKVLVAGGIASGASKAALASAEIYEPDLGTWVPASPMAAAVAGARGTLLQGGQLFVTGGLEKAKDAATTTPASLSQLYDRITGTWTPGASMVNPRSLHTATTLPDGRVLVAGGKVPMGPGDPVSSSISELYDPVATDWTSAASMRRGRTHHTATSLSGGRVLVAGGKGPHDEPLSSAEMYDSAAGTWTALPPMKSARAEHTATLLPSGLVLFVGGQGPPELYDPASGTWTQTAALGTPRSRHVATALPNGRVLVAGGAEIDGSGAVLDDKPLASAELYDPTAGTWQKTGSMSVPRAGAALIQIRGGKTLVAGGSSGGDDSEASAETYDADAGTWSPVASMKHGRKGCSVLLLAEGRPLIIGGVDHETHDPSAPSVVADLEAYDPGANEWTVIAKLELARAYHTALVLPVGDVLIAGGIGNLGVPADAVEIFDSRTGEIHKTARMITARANHTTTLLPDGRVLAAGDVHGRTEIYDPASHWAAVPPALVARADHTIVRLFTGEALIAGGRGAAGFLASAERFDPVSHEWSPAGDMATARADHAATSLPGGMLVTGGIGAAGYLASAEWYAGGTKWSPAGDMASPRALHTATILSDGASVVVTGGWGDSGALAGVESYDAAAGTWKKLASMGQARYRHTATLLSDGRLIAAGGWGPTGPLASVEIYDPAKGTWTAAGHMLTPRADHTASPLDDGQVLVAGGVNNDGPLDAAEIYDPKTDAWSAVATMLHARTAHVAAPLGGSRVILAGGADTDGPLSSAEVYEPTSRTWLLARSLELGRRRAAIAPIDGDRVVIVGGSGASGLPTSSAELFTLIAPGLACDHGADCQSGFCTDSVCCNGACDKGDCDGCSVLTGAHQSGACELLTSTPCDDGDHCTLGDRCVSGACEPGAARDCGKYACDPSTAECRHSCESVDDCSAGNACTPDSQCIPDPPTRGAKIETSCGVSPSGASEGGTERAPWRGGLLFLLAMSALAGRRLQRSRPHD